MRNVFLRILKIAAGVTIAGLLLGWYMGAGDLGRVWSVSPSRALPRATCSSSSSDSGG